MVGVGQSGIHEPELDILDIGFLEIGIIQLAHHTAPTLFRVRQFTILTDHICGDVILSALLGIIGEVKYGQFGIYVAGFLTIRVYLVLIDDTRTMVAHRRQIITDMIRRVGLRVTEDRIDGVPSQVRTTAVISRCVGREIDSLFIDNTAWRGCQEPVVREMDVDIGCCRLEIIDIRRSLAPHISGVTRDEVCKLRVDRESGGGCRGYPGDLVNRIREPLELGLPAGVQTPDGVSKRFVTHINFRGQRTFA